MMQRIFNNLEISDSIVGIVSIFSICISCGFEKIAIGTVHISSNTMEECGLEYESDEVDVVEGDATRSPQICYGKFMVLFCQVK